MTRPRLLDPGVPGAPGTAGPGAEIAAAAARTTGPGVGWLLRPKVLSALATRVTDEGRTGRYLLVGLVGAVTLPLIYLALARLLETLRETPEVGPVLAARLLGFGLLILLGILVLSNLIAALSSFFLSRDLPSVLSAPVDWLAVYGSRLIETGTTSSWMVALLLVPLVAAYGTVYGAGWAFYLVSLAALVPLLIIPAALGSMGTLMLVRVFPARRTRDILGVIAAGGVALLVLGLRVLRPERLVDPEGFRSLVDYLDVLRGPTLAWFPSDWASQAMLGPLRSGLDPFYLALLWSTAAASVVLGALLHRSHYEVCYTRAQEGGEKRVRYDALWRGLERGLGSLSLRRREMVLKDTRVFFRDATQWSQLIILGVLVVAYVYNIQVLPLRSNEAIGDFLISMVGILNVGLTGFVLAAVASRFVFPALSLEGRTLWLLRSSPLPPDTLLWSKFWSGAVPLLTVALLLAGLTGAALGLRPTVQVLSLTTITGLTLAFTAQALAWGIAYPKFESENAAQIPTSLGGFLFMLGALGTLAVVLGAQFWILRDFVASGLPWRETRAPLAGELILAYGVTLAVCVAVSVWPYRFARRKLRTLEAG